MERLTFALIKKNIYKQDCKGSVQKLLMKGKFSEHPQSTHLMVFTDSIYI